MANTLTKEGKIRTNSPCPFLRKCTYKSPSCPSRANLQAKQVYCGTARLFSIARPVAPVSVAPHVPEKFDLSADVERKLAERTRGRNWIELNVIEKLGITGRV